MTIFANAGPAIIFGSDPLNTSESNPDQAPSLIFGGIGILDPRAAYGYHPGQAPGSVTAGWGASSQILTLQAIPQTASNSIIAADGHTTSGQALVLASTSVDGLSVGNTIFRADTGAQVTGLLQIDPAVMTSTCSLVSGSNVLTVTAIGAAGGHSYNRISYGMTLTDASTAGNIPTGATIIGYGTGNGGKGTYYMSAAATATAASDTVTGRISACPLAVLAGADGVGNPLTVRLWNPQAMLSRCVIITASSASAATTTFTVRGYDVFCYPMQENIVVTPASALTTTGKKAFKYIASITPNATDGTYNFRVGTVDTIGFPIRSDQFVGGLGVDATIIVNTAIITSGTGYTAADPVTATATTGDVRGTYALQSSSNGTLPVLIMQTPPLAGLSNDNSVGLYGQTQYADF